MATTSKRLVACICAAFIGLTALPSCSAFIGAAREDNDFLNFALGLPLDVLVAYGLDAGVSAIDGNEADPGSTLILSLVMFGIDVLLYGYVAADLAAAPEVERPWLALERPWMSPAARTTVAAP